MEQSVPVQRLRAFFATTLIGQKLAQFPVSFTIFFFSSLFHFACLIGNSDSIVSVLAVSPSATFMSGKLWTLITSSLVENNTLKYGAFLGIALMGTYRLEQEMGSQNLAKYLVIVATASSFLSASIFIAVYVFTLNDEIFFSHVYGLGGLVVSIVVAMVKTRKMPSSETLIPEKIFVLPFVFGYAVLGLKFPLYDALLVILSFLVSVWQLTGEDFSYRSFLPNSLINPSTANAEQIMAVPPLPTPDPAKERLRARGFKLLDKKLAELEAAPEIPLDVVEKGEGEKA